MLADTQQQRLLQRLRQAGKQPVALAELHACGIDFPAAVVSELGRHDYAIERVYNHGRLIGVRLLGPLPPKRSQRSRGAGAPGSTDSQPPHTPRSPKIAQAPSDKRASGRCSRSRPWR
jgi:hypothetical protein